jgi:iron complex outermembrane recepter protein
MNRLFFFFLALVSCQFTLAQSVISGTVKDAANSETIPGVTVMYSDGKGAVTDIDGAYRLELDPGKYVLTVTYVGMQTQTREVELGSYPVVVNFILESITMKEVTVTADIAVGRRTPVAYTDVSSVKIREELGTRDLPLVLNTTPGVYATQTGGGDGDARINIRGFNQRYVAVMVDGVPMNDMENGWVYWSNWFGLDVVTQKIQVQRGLGASKLSIPSVGGTINVMSSGIDQAKRITISSEAGNNLNLRQTVGFNSGRLKGGWGVTAALSYRRNDGWVENLGSRQLFYFAKLQKEFLNHSLSLSIMGSPQEHNQRNVRRPIAFYDKAYAASVGADTAGVVGDFGIDHNIHWGTFVRSRAGDTGEEETLSERSNYYHKPIVNFRHFWTPTEKLSISNVLYASTGDGGGTSLQTSVLDENAQTDFNGIYYSNTNAPSIFVPVYDLTYVNDTSQYKSRNFIRSQENNHFWAGIITTFKYQVNKRVDISGGFDGRYYYTDRFQIMWDLLGGDYAVPSAQGSDPNNPSSVVVREGDIFEYKIRTYVKQGGVFFLTEYHKDELSAFVNLTGSVNAYNRTNYFALKTEDGGYPSSGWKTFNGGTLKAGASYNINENVNVFVNAGYLSRAQMMSNVFVGRSLDTYQNIENEVIIAQEVGATYSNDKVRVVLNAYNTRWNNRPVVQTFQIGTDVFFANIPGMNALHQGVELETEISIPVAGFPKVKKPLIFEGVVSVGDWRWISDGLAVITDQTGLEVGRFQFGANGVKVGDAAQTQLSAGLRFEPIKGLYFKPRVVYFDNNYSDFDPETLQGENSNKQSWKMPAYYNLDLNLGYNKKLGDKGQSLGIRVNLMNVTNVVFVSDARNNDFYNPNDTESGNTGFNATSAGVYMGMGFRWNVGVSYQF